MLKILVVVTNHRDGTFLCFQSFEDIHFYSHFLYLTQFFDNHNQTRLPSRGLRSAMISGIKVILDSGQ